MDWCLIQKSQLEELLSKIKAVSRIEDEMNIIDCNNMVDKFSFLGGKKLCLGYVEEMSPYTIVFPYDSFDDIYFTEVYDSNLQKIEGAFAERSPHTIFIADNVEPQSGFYFLLDSDHGGIKEIAKVTKPIKVKFRVQIPKKNSHIISEDLEVEVTEDFFSEDSEGLNTIRTYDFENVIFPDAIQSNINISLQFSLYDLINGSINAYLTGDIKAYYKCGEFSDEYYNKNVVINPYSPYIYEYGADQDKSSHYYIM